MEYSTYFQQNMNTFIGHSMVLFCEKKTSIVDISLKSEWVLSTIGKLYMVSEIVLGNICYKSMFWCIFMKYISLSEYGATSFGFRLRLDINKLISINAVRQYHMIYVHKISNLQRIKMKTYTYIIYM